MQAGEEDIKRWQEIAKRRNAILPASFQFIARKEILIICGNCQTSFTRPLITGQFDPVFVCPHCEKRNYIPIDWNVIRK